MSFEGTLVRLEEGFWIGDADYYRQHLAEHARFVLPNVGIMERDAVVTAIAAGERWSMVRFSEVGVLQMGQTAAWLTYRATAERAGNPVAYEAYIGSCYVQRDGEWRLACHQQTVA